MKTILSVWFALLCLIGITANAQKQFHNGNGFAKFTEDTTIILVHLKPYIVKSNFINAHKTTYDPLHTNADVTALTVLSTLSRKTFIEQLEADESIDFVYHALWNNGIPAIPTGAVLVELKYGETIEETLKAAGLTGQLQEKENPITNLERASGKILPDSVRPMQIFITTKDLVFDISNKLFETGKVRYAQPDFYIPIKGSGIDVFDPLYTSKLVETVPILKTHLLFRVPPPAAPNDPGYSFQTNLADMGQLDSAWLWHDWAKATYPTNQGIIICDDGLDSGTLKQPDLNRVAGYTIQNVAGGGIPTYTSDYHGTACAGIAAAIRNNSYLIAGIASGANVKSVNVINIGGITVSQVASNLHWAWASGAYRVISNSWTYGSISPLPAITTEIDNGMAYGSAAGDGSLFVFSTGNNSGGPIGFPNNISGVFTVGAASSLGVRNSYSNYGPEIEAVATVPAAGVVTIDRIGALGATSNDQYNSFAGTSAACPQAAGAAQILANVVPTATGNQLYMAMISGATDVYTAGFDYETGFGRINVYKSLAKLLNTTAVITPLPIVSPLYRDFEMTVADPWSTIIGPYLYNWSVDPTKATISILPGYANKKRVRVTKVPGALGIPQLFCNFGPIAGIWISKYYYLILNASGISRVIPGDSTIELKNIRSQQLTKLTESTVINIIAGPVPAHNTLMVSLEDDDHSKNAISRIEINSLETLGTRVFVRNYPSQTYNPSITVAGIKPGVYVLSVYSGDRKATKKIMIF
jgi:subtilisin family serine protease